MTIEDAIKKAGEAALVEKIVEEMSAYFRTELDAGMIREMRFQIIIPTGIEIREGIFDLADLAKCAIKAIRENQ